VPLVFRRLRGGHLPVDRKVRRPIPQLQHLPGHPPGRRPTGRIAATEVRGASRLNDSARHVWTAACELDPNLAGLAYLHSTHPERSSTIDLRRAYRYAAEIAAD
jgi:hypothetical protein